MKRLALLVLLAGCGTADPLDQSDAGRDAGPADSGTGGGSGGSGGGSSGDPRIDEILQAHNAIRGSAMPAPSPALTPLTWSETAAAKATAWAEQCQWKHNPALGNQFGENIYASMGASQATPTTVVTSWGIERLDYNYPNNTCAAGKQCGHYTQIVWRDTTAVGCASKVCTTGSPWGSGSWLFWVCDYTPPGNFVGRKPY